MKVSLLYRSVSLPCRMLVVIAGLLIISSCGNTKKLIYFQEDVKSDHPAVTPVAPTETLIQADDILSIIVSSANPEASVQFNSPNESTPNTNSGASTGNTLTIGYLVNQNGDIQFPVLGIIHVEGLTKLQLTQYLTKQLLDKQLLVDPIVTIRYLNFRVSVIGEVMKPGVYTVPNEKLTLMEAIALAGDLSVYGNRDNVSLIRENGKGEKTIQKLNLKSRDILTSPYFYLKSNDIIYVEPIKDRVAMERSTQYMPIVFSITSLLIVVLDRVWK